MGSGWAFYSTIIHRDLSGAMVITRKCGMFCVCGSACVCLLMSSAFLWIGFDYQTV